MIEEAKKDLAPTGYLEAKITHQKVAMMLESAEGIKALKGIQKAVETGNEKSDVIISELENLSKINKQGYSARDKRDKKNIGITIFQNESKNSYEIEQRKALMAR